jgi:hypothetical protein
MKHLVPLDSIVSSTAEELASERRRMATIAMIYNDEKQNELRRLVEEFGNQAKVRGLL